jgi:hypothetical protein
MIEVYEIFWTSPIELRTIILASIVMGGYMLWTKN